MVFLVEKAGIGRPADRNLIADFKGMIHNSCQSGRVTDRLGAVSNPMLNGIAYRRKSSS
jgi:hypothetical protein